MQESTSDHRALVVRTIQVYQLLGHAIEEILPVDEARTDLKIRSEAGELWLARCQTTELVDSEALQDFIVSCALHGPQQLAVITTGQFTDPARAYVEGHPIYLLDEPTLREFRAKAERRVIQRALQPVALPEEVGVSVAAEAAGGEGGAAAETVGGEGRAEAAADGSAEAGSAAPAPGPRPPVQCRYCGAENAAGALLCDYCDRSMVVTRPLSLDAVGAQADELPEPMFSAS